MDKITNQLTLVTVQDGKDGIDGDGSAAGVYSGTCDTLGSIQTKIVILEKTMEAKNGAQIAVRFAYENTSPSAKIQLCLNDGKQTLIGNAYPIYAGDRELTYPDIYGWRKNQVINFIFFNNGWYITSASAANAMKFEDGKLQIYNNQYSDGFKAELGDKALDFKIGQDNLAHYGVNGVELYNAAGGETNTLKGQPYAQFGATTILGYNKNDEPHLTAQRNYLAMNDSSGEYFRVSRKGLMYKATIDQDNNQWLGISPDGKIGIVNNYEDIINDKDNMIVDSTIKVGGKNLLLQSNNYNNFYCTSNNDDTKIFKDTWLNNDTAVVQMKLSTISADDNIAKIFWNNQFQNNAILSSDKNYVISYDLLFKKSVDLDGGEYDTIDGTLYTTINFIINAVTNNNETTAYYNIINQNKIVETALKDSFGNNYLHHECYFTINDKDSNGIKIDITNCRYYPAISIPKMDSDDHYLRVYITNLKLEEGNIPTNWEPAPEDNNIPIESIAAALGIIKVESNDISKYKGSIGFDNNTGTFITQFIASNMLQTDAIYSSNVKRDPNSNDDSFLLQGTLLDLGNGELNSKNFRINADGNAFFNGTITATAGNIGGFTINDNILKSKTVGISGQANSYNEDKMLWAGAIEENNKISDANFYITNDGFMKAISGDIGGITINSNGLNTNNETGFKLFSNGDFSLGSALTYKNNSLSLSQGSVSISSFNTDEQTQLNMTKYITSKDGKITFSNIDEGNNPTGSKLIIDSEGLKLSDGTTEKISISSSEVLIGSSDNGVNIANDNISIKQRKQGIDISSTSIDFKNINGIKVMSLSTKDNSSSILLGNKEVANSTYMEFSPSGITLGKTNEEYISSQMFSLSEKGFIFGSSEDIDSSNLTAPYFAIGDKLAYDENIGFGISMNAPGLIWKNPNLKNDALWENDSNASGGAPVNILITDHGMGFFQENQVNDPIAYFSNNKFYVKRTQVVTEQEISGFKWFVRDGSDYVTENGKTLHNLGLKWVG